MEEEEEEGRRRRMVNGDDDHDEYTEDGTVDLKGKPILKSKTGRWKACSFVVGTFLLSPFSSSYNHFLILLNILISQTITIL